MDSSSLQKILLPYQHLKIQLEEIIAATNNFNRNNRIGVGGYGPVYIGEVSHYGGRSMVAIKRLDPKGGQGMPEFLKEITMLSKYRDENIVSLLGFCCEGPEMILVYEHASRGSLDSHLNSHDLSWTQRLKICLDVAKGLSYLHDPKERHQRLIHCDMKCGNVLLDDQWNAKVSDFGLSIMGSANEQQSVIITLAAGTRGYIDPQYQMTNTLTKESDVYSFGVVLFEILCGRLCSTFNDGRLQILFFREGRPKMSEVVTTLETAIEIQEFSEWILRLDNKKMTRSVEPPLNHTYNDVLRKLLPKGILRNGETTFLQKFQHLNIQLEEIISATKNFDDENYIKGGGFGKLYEGEVCLSKGRSMVTIKRLNRRNGQGTPEFLKEIVTHSHYSHENLISLLGFCCEGSEMILVYEHASRGSLDRYLSSPDLTWSQRLKICLDVAKGLSYLHDPRDTHQTLIHGDLKSANILLDDQWNGKVSDFGLSVIVSAEQQPVVVAPVAGTEGYIDQSYAVTHTLTKDSDLYSFGVVLFEVLCGTLCCTYSDGRVQQVLVPMWIESYGQSNLNDIIFKSPIIQPLDQSSLEIVSDIAYVCLIKVSREDRLKMFGVVTQLQVALKVQNFSEWDLLVDYEEMARSAKPPLNYRSKLQLWKLLSKGVLLNGGNTYFLLKKKGEHCEKIRIEKCMDLDSSLSEGDVSEWPFDRPIFGKGILVSVSGKFNIHVKTQFLTPGITYMVYLVFRPNNKYGLKRCEYIGLRYKLEGETKEQISPIAYERKDRWWECELCHFTSDHKIVDLKIMFVGIDKYPEAALDCIEFRPLEEESLKYRPDMAEGVTALEREEYSEWEPPSELEGMIKTAQPSLSYSSNAELRTLLSKPVLLSYREGVGKAWFSLNKKGEHREMIPIAECLDLSSSIHDKSEHKIYRRSCYIGGPVRLRTRVQTQFLSPGTEYKMYLVFKFMCPASKLDAKCHELIYLRYKMNGTNTAHISYIADEREDGWWMCELIPQFTCEARYYDIEIQFECFSVGSTFIQAVGFEFLPVLEKVKHEPESIPDADWENFKEMTVSISDADWERYMPSNYEEIMGSFKHRVQWETEKELYLLMRNGFLINDGKEWFYLDKQGKSCHMLSARALDDSGLDIFQNSESRFQEAGILVRSMLQIYIDQVSQLLFDGKYAAYLVYKLRRRVSYNESHMQVRDVTRRVKTDTLITLNTLMLSPFNPEASLSTHTRVDTSKIKGFPQKRDDGWLEVQIYESESHPRAMQFSKEIGLEIYQYSHLENYSWLFIEGIEFRRI